MIQVYSNSLGAEELSAIEAVFKSRWVGRGKECEALEKELAAFWNTEEVLLTNNCTAALYLALKALGVGQGDEVIISTMNFLACANAVMEAGAVPVFADVEPRYYSILPSEIERLKTPRTRALFMLHYGGHPADFDAIRAACGQGVAIIEDSANAVASQYRGRYCGTLGEAGAFSFDAMKTLVMGDGGALVIRDRAVRERAKALRYLGFAHTTTSGLDALKKGTDRWWEFEVDEPSGRFISNDVLAAVGRCQLKRLPDFIARRKRIWEAYQQAFAGLRGLAIPPEPLPETTSSYYMYWLTVPGRRDAFAKYLVDNGIYATFRYHPLHRVPRYGSSERLPNAERIMEEAINIPIHQNVTDTDLDHIINRVKAFFR